MLWHRYPCKCSAQCLWILRALFCTWIVRVVGDHLILRRWWLTHAFISGYAPLWCQQRGRDQKRKREGWSRREMRRNRGEGRERRKKEIQRDRQKAMPGWERQIPHNHVLLMCGNVQERVFINTVDTKHSFIRKHKEHFALADIINTALSSTKTRMKRGNHVLYNKSCQ